MQLVRDLEQFTDDHPNSAWTPSVRLQVGLEHVRRLNYSGALFHLARAYTVAAQAPDARGQALADEAGRHFGKLLAMTGQLPEFYAFAQDYKQRKGPDSGREIYEGLEMAAWISRYPDSAYICGLQCVDQLGRVTQPDGYNPSTVYFRTSLPIGYDGAELIRIGEEAGLSLRGMVLSLGEEPPVPSIAHLKVGHYVVLRQQDGPFYEVVDPATPGPRWLTAEELAPELSGFYVVNGRMTRGMSATVSLAEAAQYRGRCTHGTPMDANSPPPPGCPPPPGSNGPDDGPAMGPDPGLGNGGGCCGPMLHGMPVWWVDEPYLNLWVSDTPLSYRPAYGPAVDFTLRFRTRSDIADFITGLTTPTVPPASRIRGDYYDNWFCSWISWIAYDVDSGNQATVFLPQGGTLSFSFAPGVALSQPNYWTHWQLEKQFTGADVTGFRLKMPDGRRLEFSSGYSADPNFEYFRKQFLMTADRDAQGYATLFQWSFAANPRGHLTNVVAADGTQFAVVNDLSSDTYGQISDVTSVVGLNVSLGYGETGAHPDGNPGSGLTSITDTAGIKSSLYLRAINAGYGFVDASYIQTPYGRTTIMVAGANGSSAYTENTVERYVDIVHADGSKEAYGTMSYYTGGDWPAWTAGQKPSVTDSGLTTMDTTERQYRNTFHWSKAARAIMTKDFAADTLNWADFKLARIRHWLTHTEDDYTHWGTLSWEQSPSPDQVQEGAVKWYDYVGKPYGANNNRGTEVLPTLTARVMPDPGTTTQWKLEQRNAAGRATNVIERWVDGGVTRYRTNRYVYAANGVDLLEHYGPDGVRLTGTLYNGYGQPLRVTNTVSAANPASPVMEVTVYTYNARSQVDTITRPSGFKTVHGYDGPTGDLRTITDYDGTTPFRTNLYQRVLNQTLNRPALNGGSLNWWTEWKIHTSPYGLTVTNVYDSLGRPLERWYPGTVNKTEKWHYELWPGQSYTTGTGGKLILDKTGYVDRLGNTTAYTYDPVRRLAYVQDPLNTTTYFQYCDCGGPSQITKGWGLTLAETTSYGYDLAARRTNVVYPGLGAITNQFDALGRLTITTDALGSRWHKYDNLNRLIQVTNSFGVLETRLYDDYDRVVSATDHNGVTTTNRYDTAGRITSRALVGGGTESWGYVANVGGPTSYTNQINKVSQYSYHAAGWKTNEVTVGVMTNRFVYNGAGDLVRLWDGNQSVATSGQATNGTQWRYDAYGRVQHKVYANNITNLTYTYDALGRLTNRWSQAKGNTEYRYDANGNLSVVNYPSGTTDLTFGYDALNRMTNMVDAVGTTKYAYANGLLLWEDGPWTSGTNTWIDRVSYDYNNARVRSQLVIYQPAGSAWTNSYIWDAAHRLATETSPAGTHTYTYNGPGSLVKNLALPGGRFITNEFDSLARLWDTQLKTNGGTVVNRHGYALNNAHQRTTLSRTKRNSTGWNGYNSVTYDDAGEVRTVNAFNASGVSVPAENVAYGYDAGWNLLKRTNNAAVTTYGVNGLNQATSLAGINCSYDANGNRTSWDREVDTYTYAYNAEDQLISVETSNRSFRTDFVYDGKQRLRRRIDSSGYNGTIYTIVVETRYLYDGLLLIQERSSANHPKVTYTRGRDLSGSLAGAGGIGGLLARSDHATSGTYQPTTHVSYHADGNGNVTYLATVGAGTWGAYKYDPFGRTLATGGTVATANSMRFSSKLWLADSGLYYYGYRFYDPNSQRWLNRDPMQEKSGVNLYGFAGNDGLTQFDAFGLEADEVSDENKDRIMHGTVPKCHIVIYIGHANTFPGGVKNEDCSAASVNACWGSQIGVELPIPGIIPRPDSVTQISLSEGVETAKKDLDDAKQHAGNMMKTGDCCKKIYIYIDCSGLSSVERGLAGQLGLKCGSTTTVP